MSQRVRPLVIAVALAAALALLARTGFARWLGESPRYPACVEAMEQVAAGQPWVEAERHIAAAVAAGGEHDARWPVAREARGPGVVTCRRYEPDLNNEGLALLADGSVLQSVRMWARCAANGAFNLTRFELVREPASDSVASVAAHDCCGALVDTMDCREHRP